ncbi:hypothetical protein [Pseudoxanthomonas mexicana]
MGAAMSGRALAAEIDDGPSVGEVVLLHLQQARKFADFLPGGRSHDTVVSEHVFSPEEAANHLRHELDIALAAMGARA